MTKNKTIHSNLKTIAKRNNVESIRQLADMLDYRFESVRLMYNDEMKRYPRELLASICEVFNVEIDEVLMISDNKDEKDSEQEANTHTR